MKNETNYHIGTFTGVLGNLSDSNLAQRIDDADAGGSKRKHRKG